MIFVADGFAQFLAACVTDGCPVAHRDSERLFFKTDTPFEEQLQLDFDGIEAGLGHDKSAFGQGFQLVRCHQWALNHLQRARSFAFALCDRTGERRPASHCFGENLCRLTVGRKTTEYRQLCVVDNDLRAFLAVVFL